MASKRDIRSVLADERQRLDAACVAVGDAGLNVDDSSGNPFVIRKRGKKPRGFAVAAAKVIHGVRAVERHLAADDTERAALAAYQLGIASATLAHLLPQCRSAARTNAKATPKQAIVDRVNALRKAGEQMKSACATVAHEFKLTPGRIANICSELRKAGNRGK